MSTDNGNCCPIKSVAEVVDFSTSLNSAIPFLERRGLIETKRHPHPRLDVGGLRELPPDPLAAPLPLPDLQRYLNGNPPPDGPITREWPHPDYPDE